uniref:TnpR resolvase n=2 Tax=Geobacillus TaxID=129337 RepID=A0A0B5KBW5_9BACL|nr:TnpR resolvase [Geobacillus sp. enrichment culture clone fosmid MGS-MG1]
MTIWSKNIVFELHTFITVVYNRFDQMVIWDMEARTMTDVRRLVEWLQQQGVRADLVKPRAVLPSYRQWMTANGKGMSGCHG